MQSEGIGESAYLSVVLQPLGGDLGNAVLYLALSTLVGSAHGGRLSEGSNEVRVDVLLEIACLF